MGLVNHFFCMAFAKHSFPEITFMCHHDQQISWMILQIRFYAMLNVRIIHNMELVWHSAKQRFKLFFPRTVKGFFFFLVFLHVNDIQLRTKHPQ